MVIRVRLNPLEETTEFTYLNRMVMYNNSDWEELYSSLIKAQRRLGGGSKGDGEGGGAYQCTGDDV